MKLVKRGILQRFLHKLIRRILQRPDETRLLPRLQSLIFPLVCGELYSAETKRVLTCSMLMILMIVIGCDDSKRRGISGKIYLDLGIDHSMIASGDIEQSEYKAVTDATVYLAFDREGLLAIEGTTVKTNSSGSYHIKTSELPPPKDPSGCYYLIVKKTGHDVFSHPVKIGMMSSYQQNRVFLSQPSK